MERGLHSSHYGRSGRPRLKRPVTIGPEADKSSTADPTRRAFGRRERVAATDIAVALRKGRKRLKIRFRGLFGSGSGDPLKSRIRQIFSLRPILEPIMATFTRSRSLLVSASLAALGGTALAALLAGSGFILADARATAVDVSLPLADADIPICGTPTATARPNMMFRLVQTE